MPQDQITTMNARWEQAILRNAEQYLYASQLLESIAEEQQNTTQGMLYPHAWDALKKLAAEQKETMRKANEAISYWQAQIDLSKSQDKSEGGK